MPLPIGIAIPVIAYSAYSSYRQAQITNAQKRAEARIAELNAETAELEGELALKMALSLESESRRQTEQLIGMQRAAMSVTGFAVGEGSFANIIESTAVIGELDAAAIMFEGEIAQFRKRKEARSLRFRAKALRKSQVAPGLAGFESALSMGASLLR